MYKAIGENIVMISFNLNNHISILELLLLEAGYRLDEIDEK